MNAIGAFGYLLVGALYLFLTLLLLTAWRGRRIATYLILACLISVVWGFTLAFQSAGWNAPPQLLLVIEVLRTGAWIAFVARLIAEIGGNRAIRYLANLIWLGVLGAGLASSIFRPAVAGLLEPSAILIWGGLLTNLTGLVLIEQLYRNSPWEARRSLKLLLFGLGGVFVYDLFLFSQAIVFAQIDLASWIARGPINVFFVPIIAAAARLNPDWNLRIFISRQIVFYTATLTAAGLYLIIISAGGYLIARYGGDWGGILRILFFAAAVTVLVVLLFSRALRARLRVFLSKHFFQNKYDYREEWLRLTSTLSKFEDSTTRDVVVEAMAQIVHSPAGLLWIREEPSGVYRPAAKYGTDDNLPDLAPDDAIIRFIEQDGWLIDLNEYQLTPERYGDLVLPDWLQQLKSGWLIVPVMYGKELIGLVLLFAAPGSPRLNYEDRDLLKTVGNHIGVLLAQEKSERLLAEAKQFEAYNRLTAFLMHDLNNLIAQQSLIVKNADKHRRNPEFVDDTMRTIANSVERMKRVMDRLQRREESRRTRLTELRFVVSAAVDRCADQAPVPSIHSDDANPTLEVDAEQFTMVLSHLIKNAQEATPPDGKISVITEGNDGQVLISIQDSGCGMTSDFIRDHLFRPFDSTKGSQGMGIGAYQAREFARKMGGELHVKSSPASGTTVTMILPVKHLSATSDYSRRQVM